MVIFFTEEDIISFGEYLLSDNRRMNMINIMNITDENIIKEQLSKVHEDDLSNWAYLNTHPNERTNSQ